jgi:hypothetical protein
LEDVHVHGLVVRDEDPRWRSHAHLLPTVS